MFLHTQKIPGEYSCNCDFTFTLHVFFYLVKKVVVAAFFFFFNHEHTLILLKEGEM